MNSILTITVSHDGGYSFSASGPQEVVIKLYKEWLARRQSGKSW